MGRDPGARRVPGSLTRTRRRGGGRRGQGAEGSEPRRREAAGGGCGLRVVLIPLAIFVLFQLYPMAYAFYVSAHQWGGITGTKAT